MALPDGFTRLLLRLHDWKTRRKLERVFHRGEDPYGYRSHPHELHKQEIVEELLAGQEYSWALEVGCAEGAFTQRLARFCDHVVALDISSTALTRAREHLNSTANIRLLRANARDFDLSSGWDLVVVSEVLYYIEDGGFLRRAFHQFLDRLAASLNAGGRMVVLHSFGNDDELRRRKSYVERLLMDGRLRLIKEFAAGDDPGKCRYLVSLLESRELD